MQSSATNTPIYVDYAQKSDFQPYVCLSFVVTARMLFSNKNS